MRSATSSDPENVPLIWPVKTPGAASRGGQSQRATRLSEYLRRADPWVAVVIIAIGTVVSYLRLPSIARDTIWAEDGALFLTERTAYGPWTRLFSPYDGYLHLVPRFVIEIASSIVPLEHFAVAVTAICSLVVGLVAGLVYWLARDLVTWWPARLAVAGLTFLGPTLPQEVLGNAANLHWFFLWASLWIVLYRARSWRSSVGLGLVALVMALSDIQLLLFTPLLLLRVKDRRMWPIAAGLALGLAAQVASLVADPRVRPGESAPIASIVEGFFAQGVLGIWTGSNPIAARLLGDNLLPIAALASVPIVLAAGYTLWRGSTRQRILIAALLLGAAVSWTASFALNPNPAFFYSEFTSAQWAGFFFLRYAVVPAMLLAATLPVAASVAAGRGHRVIPVILVAILLVTAVVNLRPDGTGRSNGPAWDVGVEGAETTCELDSARERIDIPVAPGALVATVSCDTLIDR